MCAAADPRRKSGGWLRTRTWPTKAVGASLIAILQMYHYWVTVLVSVAPGYPSYCCLSIGLKDTLRFFVGGVALSNSSIHRNSGGLFSQRKLLSLDLKHGGSPESYFDSYVHVPILNTHAHILCHCLVFVRHLNQSPQLFPLLS